MAVLLAAPLQPAFSHDTFQTTVVARLKADELEVRVTLSELAARLLARPPGAESGPVAMADFAALQPKLSGLAARLIEVLPAGKNLSPTRSTVLPGEHGDVEFQVVYPRPDTLDFQVHAAFLTQLGQGFMAQLTLLDESGRGPIITLKDRHKPMVKWGQMAAELKPELAVSPAVFEAPDVMNAPMVTTVVEPPALEPSRPALIPEVKVRVSPQILMAILVGMAGVSYWLWRRKFAR